jgi:AcrR family transcriptional regulator
MPRATAVAPDPKLAPESTREAILRTAGRVFLAHGYEQTSMDEIALQAGVARRTVYNQFAGKRVLFDAAMAQLWDSMPLDAIVAATKQTGPAEDVLHAIGLAIARFWAPPEAVAFLRLVIWESPRFPELGHGLMDKGRSPARRAVARYVTGLASKREFRIDDPELAATQFIDVIVGEVLLARLVATSSAAVPDDRCDYLAREATALFIARYRKSTAKR